MATRTSCAQRTPKLVSVLDQSTLNFAFSQPDPRAAHAKTRGWRIEENNAKVDRRQEEKMLMLNQPGAKCFV